MPWCSTEVKIRMPLTRHSCFHLESKTWKLTNRYLFYLILFWLGIQHSEFDLIDCLPMRRQRIGLTKGSEIPLTIHHSFLINLFLVPKKQFQHSLKLSRRTWMVIRRDWGGWQQSHWWKHFRSTINTLEKKMVLKWPSNYITWPTWGWRILGWCLDHQSWSSLL